MATRRRSSHPLATLAWQAPMVAAHRLATDLASPNPLTVALEWQRLMLEKYVVGWQVGIAMATSILRQTTATGSVQWAPLAEATLSPIARRVQRNASTMRRRATRR